MSDTGQTAGKTWLYRFSEPGEVEIETGEFASDEAADTHARELSKARATPVVIERHGLVAWQYVTEADARP